MTAGPLFEGPGPRVFAVAPGADFAHALAVGLRARLAKAPPEAVARVEIVLGARRVARAAAAAFEAEGLTAGAAAFLPRLRTLAEVAADPLLDLPPAVDPERRRLTLTRLVAAFLAHAPDLGPAAAAPDLAAALMRLMDEAAAEGVDLAELDAAAPPEHAEHWATTLHFLTILRAQWPAILAAAEGGAVEPGQRRRAGLALAAQAWAEGPPGAAILAAGASGADGAGRDFLAAVARARQGAAILPGFDPALAAEVWDDIGEGHPWGAHKALLDALGLAPLAVDWWTPPPDRAPRRRLLAQALRPAPVTDRWREALPALRAEFSMAVNGLAVLEAPDPRREAAAAALALREAIETPGARAALITPDRDLARRVTAQLRRWGIEPDDSGGRPLALTPPGAFLRLTADAALAPFDPVLLLATLKHPLCAAGPGRGAHLAATRRFEIAVLRRRPDLDGLDAARAALEAEIVAAEARARDAGDDAALVDDKEDDGALVVDTDGDAATIAQEDATGVADAHPALREGASGVRRPAAGASGPPAAGAALRQSEAAASALSAAGGELAGLVPVLDALAAVRAAAGSDGVGALDVLAAAHMAAAERLAGPALWDGPAGAAALVAAQAFAAAAGVYGPCPTADYPALFAAGMTGEARESAFLPDQRVMIWGPLEARTQTADLVILGGLNEGVWPAAPAADPWLSRPMRASVGLPAPERLIGLAALDVLSAACGGRVILSRALRAGGAPTTRSRWLERLATLVQGIDPEAQARLAEPGRRLLALAETLDRPHAPAAAAPRPAPRPPLRHRPRRLSATEVETLIRDPFAIYAKRVLDLRALDPVGRTLDARDRGVALHRALERLAQPAGGEALEDAFMAAVAALERQPAGVAQRRLWRARLMRARGRLLVGEAGRRAEGTAQTEVEGAREGGGLTLTARADRIDLRADGTVAIYDYKTGKPPSDKQIDRFAKQLPLEAAIAEVGGFRDLAAARVAVLAHITLGGAQPGEALALGKDAGELAAEAWDGLMQLIEAYGKFETAYPARARPARIEYASDYDHLARFGEWEDGDAAEAAGPEAP